MEGKVYFTGAGSKDIGQLTVKAYWAIKQADTVVYDAHVDFSVLLAIPCDTMVYQAEKVMAEGDCKETAIANLLVKEARQGKMVVRLVSDSPFLLGQGIGEEEVLLREKVAYEVLPGVSAETRLLSECIGVADKREDNSYTVIALQEEEDWEKAKASLNLGNQLGTLLIRTGRVPLKSIVEGLFELGISPLKDAAMVESAGKYDETITVDTLDGLSCYIKSVKLNYPVILVVGEKSGQMKVRTGCIKPVLKGVRVIVAKPVKKNLQLVELLEKQGAYVLPLPVVKVKELSESEKLQQLLKQPYEYEWIAFSNEVGVECFFRQLTRCNVDIRVLRHIKFAVIGKRTNQALLEHGCKAELIALSSYGFMLPRELAAKMENEHGKKRVLVVTAKNRENDCYSYLSQHGVACETLQLYEIVPVVPKSNPYQKGDIVTFTSSVCIEQFARCMKKEELPYVRAVCINEPVYKKAVSYGMDAWMAKDDTNDEMVNKVIECCQKAR